MEGGKYNRGSGNDGAEIIKQYFLQDGTEVRISVKRLMYFERYIKSQNGSYERGLRWYKQVSHKVEVMVRIIAYKMVLYYNLNRLSMERGDRCLPI